MKVRLLRFVAIGLVVITAACRGGGIDDSPPVRAATDSLRSALRLHDYELGARLARRWLPRARRAPELRALAIEALARAGWQTRAEAAADSFRTGRPDSPWAWYAAAAVDVDLPGRSMEADSLSAAALALGPRNPAIIELRARVLARAGRFSEAASLIDSLPPDLRRRTDIMAAKGRALSYEAYMRSDSAMNARALATLKGALARDSDDVEALQLTGQHLAAFRNEPAAGLPYLARAARLTPAPDVHEQYWQALLHDPELEPAARRSKVVADMDSLLAGRPDSPILLQAAASVCDDMDSAESRERLEARILKDFPDSPQAESVELERIGRLGSAVRRQKEEDGRADADTLAAYRRGILAFIGRPRHPRESYLGEAYLDLFELLRAEEDVDPDSLVMAVRGMVRYEHQNPNVVYGDGAVALAEHHVAPKLAERLPQEGLTQVTRQAAALHGDSSDRESHERMLHYGWARMLDALGWVYFQQGRLEASRRELNVALGYAELPRMYYHLGQVYEARADSLGGPGAAAPRSAADSLLNEAREAYVKGLVESGREDNPCRDALRSLYVRRHGSAGGYEAFVKNQVLARRRKGVLDARLDPPESVEPFALKNLSGRVVELSHFRGKIVIVDFWGTWCAPCVEEMPEFEKFYEKYRKDPNVVILTVDEGETAEHVRSWMKRKGYDFPVLIDDGYVGDSGVNGFPTTWFLNRAGEKAFERVGNAGDLTNRFQWRVEALEGRSAS